MIYLINNDGYRLCKDNRWRTFAMFGTYQSCVKIYRQLGSAIKRAKQLKARVVEIADDNLTVEASGMIIRTVPADRPGYVRNEHPPVEEFVVFDGREIKLEDQAA